MLGIVYVGIFIIRKKNWKNSRFAYGSSLLGKINSRYLIGQCILSITSQSGKDPATYYKRVRRDTITISSSDGENFYYVPEDTEDADLQTKNMNRK